MVEKELLNDKTFSQVKEYVMTKVGANPKCYGFTIRRKRDQDIWIIEYHIASDEYYERVMKER